MGIARPRTRSFSTPVSQQSVLPSSPTRANPMENTTRRPTREWAWALCTKKTLDCSYPTKFRKTSGAGNRFSCTRPSKTGERKFRASEGSQASFGCGYHTSAKTEDTILVKEKHHMTEVCFHALCKMMTKSLLAHSFGNRVFRPAFVIPTTLVTVDIEWVMGSYYI